jgi:hypothetical protein
MNLSGVSPNYKHFFPSISSLSPALTRCLFPTCDAIGFDSPKKVISRSSSLLWAGSTDAGAAVPAAWSARTLILFLKMRDTSLLFTMHKKNYFPWRTPSHTWRGFQ